MPTISRPLMAPPWQAANKARALARGGANAATDVLEQFSADSRRAAFAQGAGHDCYASN